VLKIYTGNFSIVAYVKLREVRPAEASLASELGRCACRPFQQHEHTVCKHISHLFGVWKIQSIQKSGNKMVAMYKRLTVDDTLVWQDRYNTYPSRQSNEI